MMLRSAGLAFLCRSVQNSRREHRGVSMLTRADDYPVHQTADPIATVATADKNFYDRYFFNGYARDASVFFAAALGQYPNRQVIDAAFSVVYKERQYVLRAAARAGA